MRLKRTWSDVERVRQVCKVPSISYGVMHNGAVIFTNSIGLRDIDSLLEANCDTAYRIGSCSKMITSCVLARLVGEGKLTLDDPIQKHLGDFNPAENPELGAKATLLHAGLHTTGLANPNPVMINPADAVQSVEDHEYVSFINTLPTANSSEQRFDKYWKYSNAAFGTLAQVIEAVTAVSFPSFLREQIFKPLGMKQTLLSKAETDENSNVAIGYVQMSEGNWQKVENRFVPEKSTPVLATTGIRSSVNDLLAFFSAVLNRYDEEEGIEPRAPLQKQSSSNPLFGIHKMWNTWLPRPIDDGFEGNEAAYCPGWNRVILPSAALQLMSYNSDWYNSDDKTWLTYIVGKESEPRILYGHSGIMNGAVANAYVLPGTRSAVVALSNAAAFGDAAACTVEILLQALFDLKPHVDIGELATNARDHCFRAYRNMMSEWHHNRNRLKCTASPEHYTGTYVGLKFSKIHIVSKPSADARLAVRFDNEGGLECDLERYNADAFSFIPRRHDELIRKAMIDWDYYKVGIFEFVRLKGQVVALWWQFDRNDFPALWVKEWPGMGEEDRQWIIERIGAFKKSQLIGAVNTSEELPPNDGATGS